ncbi:unnamed protein product [Rotaria sp. Silwood1]|nr:unnamed protein product [Rotaria sp. Silwood1]CAF4112794.1 unnamed protein product [Rotaria sp. Silwood1]CAF5014920.1 unnamed protein product [Rotaria sp. Silwood1]
MMNFQNAPIVSSFPISTATIDNQINNNLIGTSLWLPHLPSKFKDKQNLIHTSKSTLTIQNQQTLSTNRVLTNNKNHIDDENLEQQQQIITIDDILRQISNIIQHGEYLPQGRRNVSKSGEAQ